MACAGASVFCRVCVAGLNLTVSNLAVELRVTGRLESLSYCQPGPPPYHRPRTRRAAASVATAQLIPRRGIAQQSWGVSRISDANPRLLDRSCGRCDHSQPAASSSSRLNPRECLGQAPGNVASGAGCGAPSRSISTAGTASKRAGCKVCCVSLQSAPSCHRMAPGRSGRVGLPPQPVC
jgi:hypothetical protein